jgi:hypothetical protein
MATSCLFVLYFIYCARSGSAARRHALAQLPVLGIALTFVAAGSASVPATLRSLAAALTTGIPNGPVGVASIGVFYVAGNVYAGGAFFAGLVWVEQRLKQARPKLDPVLRRSLLVDCVALALITFATLVVTSADVIRWLGDEPPKLLYWVGIAALLPGFPIILVGLALPTLVQRRRAAPMWREAFETLRRGQAIREYVTRKPPRARPAAVLLRWARLVPVFVEYRAARLEADCFDRLRELSATLLWMGIDVGTRPITTTELRTALRIHRASVTVPDRAADVLIPQIGGRRRDDLLRLSDELADEDTHGPDHERVADEIVDTSRA